LPELAGEEYYWNDFEGMEVYTREGFDLGHVSSLMSTGAHDILVISGRGAEYMIPLREEFIVEINETDGKIIVDPPEGLLEINR
ncbi:MAG: 16S rRNA processing protein RimM, partial [Desulfobulbaceae bacterium]|nr:16S rRNA processing protein RimM [Desulfobulbaceae bacterium]